VWDLWPLPRLLNSSSRAQRLAHIPQLDGLVLAVADEVVTITLWTQVRDALSVTCKRAAAAAAAAIEMCVVADEVVSITLWT
jgi:hypothetical protein